MVKVEIPNRVLLQWDGENFKCAGPLELLEKVEKLRHLFGADPKNWAVSQVCNNDQFDDFVLIKFVQKIKRSWNFPYPHEELCHCRLVSTEKVQLAIEQGAQTAVDIARVTLAGTGCGTCRSDSEALLSFYKNLKQTS